jgi:hypothetical protein
MTMALGASELKPEQRMRLSVLLVGMAAFFVIAGPALVSRADGGTALKTARAAALLPDEVLKDKVIEVGQALGLEQAYQDRTEGLFIWRTTLTVAVEASPTCDGFFAWYLKDVGDKVGIDDPAVFPTCHLDESRLRREVQKLQETFKRRWLAAVGPVAIIGPTTQSHDSRLLVTVLSRLIRAPEAYKRRESFPPAPSGFAWRRLPEINGAVLVPERWSFKRTIGGNGGPTLNNGELPFNYFVSVENTDATGSFLTGLSLNVLLTTPRSADAESFAKALIGGFAGGTNAQVLEAPREFSDGIFHQYSCLLRMPGKTGPYLVEYRAIVNTKTKTTYVLSFEGPAPGWEEAWTKGAKMEELLLLDDNF